MTLEESPRLRSACDTCHQLKKKCSGTLPCENCVLSNSRSMCFYSATNRLGRPRGSKNRRKTSAYSTSRQNATQQERQRLAAPIIEQDQSQLPPRRSPERQESGKWPGGLDFGTGLAAESGAIGTDWDHIGVGMAGIELDGSLTVNSSQAQVPLHSPPEPIDHSFRATETDFFLDHDLFAALNDLNHTTGSHQIFASMPSDGHPHVTPSSQSTPTTSMATNSLLPTSLPISTSDNQYGEEYSGLTSPTYSPTLSSTFGALSHEQLMQERQQAVPAPATRAMNNNNNRPKSRTLSSCQCTSGLRNLLASLNTPRHVSSSSFSSGLQTPYSPEQQSFPIDKVLSIVACGLEQWAALATCPRCSTSEEQQVEEVFLLAVMSVRCVLGQLRGISPSSSASSSPIPVAHEVNTATRRGSTTRRDGDVSGARRKRRRRGESPPSPPISDELNHEDQQQPDDSTAAGSPRVRVGSFDVTGPDRAMVLGVLRTVTARKMKGAVGAMREALRSKIQEDTNDVDGTRRGSLLAHIDVMFEDLALAIKTLQ